MRRGSLCSRRRHGFRRPARRRPYAARTSRRPTKGSGGTRTDRSTCSSATTTGTGKRSSTSRSVRRTTCEPGGPDRGQPTHFFPRRNQFVFKVRVPADFGNKEVVWTLTSNGETEKTYGTLRPAYAVDETVMMANFGAGGQTGFHPDMMGNKPPKLTLEGEKKLTARAGQPVALSAVATDDGKPGRGPMPAVLVGQSHFVPNSATGLRLSWFQYRGAGRDRVRPAADQGVGGPSRRRELAMVGRMENAAGPAGQPVDRQGDVQRARHLRGPRARA